MFFKENETLYFTTFPYNVALILGELEKVITDNGGRVKPKTGGFLINRSWYAAADEEKKRAARLRNYIEISKPEAGKAADLEKRIAEIEATAEDYTRKGDESRRPATYTSYISFIYDGFYYSLWLSDIEMKLSYTKTAIIDGKHSRDTYAEDITSKWLVDDFYRLFTKSEVNEDRREAANLIFNELISAAPGKKYREGRKTRVSNTYNSGYHYETIYRPERLEKIDF